MTVRELNWCTDTQLDCGSALPTQAYVCVPAALLASPPETVHGTIEVEITQVRATTCADACGACKWVYTISYDDEFLAEEYVLTQGNIVSVLCSNCLTDFIINQGV